MNILKSRILILRCDHFHLIGPRSSVVRYHWQSQESTAKFVPHVSMSVEIYRASYSTNEVNDVTRLMVLLQLILTEIPNAKYHTVAVVHKDLIFHNPTFMVNWFQENVAITIKACKMTSCATQWPRTTNVAMTGSDPAARIHASRVAFRSPVSFSGQQPNRLRLLVAQFRNDGLHF